MTGSLSQRIAEAKQRISPPPPPVAEWVRRAQEKQLPAKVTRLPA